MDEEDEARLLAEVHDLMDGKGGGQWSTQFGVEPAPPASAFADVGRILNLVPRL